MKFNCGGGGLLLMFVGTYRLRRAIRESPLRVGSLLFSKVFGNPKPFFQKGFWQDPRTESLAGSKGRAFGGFLGQSPKQSLWSDCAGVFGGAGDESKPKGHVGVNVDHCTSVHYGNAAESAGIVV